MVSLTNVFALLHPSECGLGYSPTSGDMTPFRTNALLFRSELCLRRVTETLAMLHSLNGFVGSQVLIHNHIETIERCYDVHLAVTGPVTMKCGAGNLSLGPGSRRCERSCTIVVKGRTLAFFNGP